MKIRLSSLVLVCLVVFSSIPVNSAEAQTSSISAASIIALTNADRAAHGAGRLVEDPALSKAAQNKANDMLARGYFSHTSPDGQKPWAWLKALGYYYYRAGENLAMDFNNAEDIQKAWMNSPSHRANLLQSSYTHMGVGIARGMYKGRETTFVVEFFSTPVKTTAKSKNVITTRSRSPRS